MIYNKAANTQYAMHGSHWAVCDRCAMKFGNEQLTFEWTGLLVCEWCLDARPENMDLEVYSRIEAIPYINVRDDVSLAVNQCAVSGGTAVSGFAVAGCSVAGQRNRWGI